MPVQQALVYRNAAHTVEASVYLSDFDAYRTGAPLQLEKDFEYKSKNGILCNDAGMFKPCSAYFLRLIDHFLTANQIDFAGQEFPPCGDKPPLQNYTTEECPVDGCSYQVQIRLREAGIPALCITKKLYSGQLSRCMVLFAGINVAAARNPPDRNPPDSTPRNRNPFVARRNGAPARGR